MGFGINVRVARFKLGMKQYELARDAGISPQYLRKIEIGESDNPSKEVMSRIANSLDLSVQELFFLEDQPEIVEKK